MESSSYYPLKSFNNSLAQPYYAPGTQPWEDQLAWNDEFDEPGSADEPSASVENEILPEEDQGEEEEQAVDWGEAEELLAPFRLRKSQIEPASGGEHSSGDVGSPLVATIETENHIGLAGYA